VILLEGVGKCFPLYKRPVDRLLEWCGVAQTSRPFWALRNITLAVQPGKTTGLVGVNGSGKSTLLKLMTGTLLPTTGTLKVEGRVAALLELGTGFHPEFTGRQNIWINGQFLGMTPQEIAQRQDSIIAFSELGDFIDQPIRTYSSGMIVRLGFSIAAAVNPDVLIIDEALSVGDAHFSQKCLRRIREFKESGATILFVSHDPNAVTTLCDEAVLLHEGQILEVGKPRDVLERYGVLLAAQSTENKAMAFQRSAMKSPNSEATKSGTFEALITKVRTLDERGEESQIFFTGGQLRVELEVLFLSTVVSPTIGILIRDAFGTDLFGTNTKLKEMDLGTVTEGTVIQLEISLPLQLGEGKYTITAAVHRDETHLEKCYDWTDRAAAFSVRNKGKREAIGKILLSNTWKLNQTTLTTDRLSQSLNELFGNQQNPLSINEQSPSPYLKGFHAYEKREGNPPLGWRWVEPKAQLLLQVQGNTLRLKGFFPPQIKPEATITVRIRQHILATIRSQGENSRDWFESDLNVEPFIGSYVFLELECSESIREIPMGNQIARELSFALTSLETFDA
jgi:lipopolysaccharide transport system ATP-binding protein